MMRRRIPSSVLVGLGIVGCASPSPFSAIVSRPRGNSTVVKNADAVPANDKIVDGEFATASGRVTANRVTSENLLADGPSANDHSTLIDDSMSDPSALTPVFYQEAQAPPEAGKQFLPIPEIPAEPSTQWSAQPPSSDGPLSLADLEAFACQNNPTLLQARAQVQGALGKAIQAGLWPNPTLIYSAEQIGVEGTAGEFHGGLVRQRIVTARKLDLSREKYRARTRTTEWVALSQQYRVLNDVRVHYFRARGRQELVEVQKELLKNAEDLVVSFGEMYNVGQATRAEVHQANVQLQQQRLKLLMAENDARQALEELAALTGAELPSHSLDTPLAGELAVIDWEEALYRLLEESPQIGVARSKLEADKIAIRREIAEPVPDIIVEGGAGYNFEAGETVGVASVMMDVPVFDWNQGTIRQAEADYARQQGELRRIELLLRQQLAQQYGRYLTAVQHVRNYEKVILPEAEQAYDLRLKSYQADRAPWTDVLSAEQDYFMHRAQYIQNLIVWRENEVSIMGFLLHGGVSDPPNVTPPGHVDAVPQPR